MILVRLHLPGFIVINVKKIIYILFTQSDNLIYWNFLKENTILSISNMYLQSEQTVMWTFEQTIILLFRTTLNRKLITLRPFSASSTPYKHPRRFTPQFSTLLTRKLTSPKHKTTPHICKNECKLHFQTRLHYSPTTNKTCIAYSSSLFSHFTSFFSAFSAFSL